MIRTTLRCLPIFVGVLLALAGPVQAQKPAAVRIITETITLKKAKPSTITQLFTNPSIRPKGAVTKSFLGIVEQIVPNDLDHTLTLSGTAAAIRQFKEILPLLDVASRPVRLQIRILHFRLRAADGSQPMEVAKTAVETTTNTPVTLPLIADGKIFYVHVVPHINGDGSISLAAKMKTTDEPTVPNWEGVAATGYRRVAQGEKAVLLSVVAERGQTLQPVRTSYPISFDNGYYLELTPSLPVAPPIK